MHRIRRIFPALLLAALASCASPGKNGPAVSTAPGAQETMGPPEEFGPQPAPSPTPAEMFGPEPIQLRSIVLVLGPGMARGFAHAGALRALVAAKIPIAAVVGSEMGAFIGTLYAMEGNINHLDWALLRFKDEVFLPQQGLLNGLFSDRAGGGKLGAELRRAFGEKELSQCKVPSKIVLGTDSGAPLLVDGGRAWEAVRAALTPPRSQEAIEWSGQRVFAATSVRPFPVSEARALGLGPVVVIDVSLPGKAAPWEAALKEADLVIRPELKGIGEKDYSKRSEAAFRGKRAVSENLPAVRQWVGLPQEGLSP
ncbi:MAG: patatin-like phospholipase family protein [Oligoflexia bacterium]|nr:patatin-like phospholipase family protein [Oligoflexia bacterium]